MTDASENHLLPGRHSSRSAGCIPAASRGRSIGAALILLEWLEFVARSNREFAQAGRCIQNFQLSSRDPLDVLEAATWARVEESLGFTAT